MEQHVNCCISQLALLKSNSACWSSTKQTYLSSYQKVICSHHDIAEKLIIWHKATITHTIFSGLQVTFVMEENIIID